MIQCIECKVGHSWNMGLLLQWKSLTQAQIFGMSHYTIEVLCETPQLNSRSGKIYIIFDILKVSKTNLLKEIIL